MPFPEGGFGLPVDFKAAVGHSATFILADEKVPSLQRFISSLLTRHSGLYKNGTYAWVIH